MLQILDKEISSLKGMREIGLFPSNPNDIVVDKFLENMPAIFGIAIQYHICISSMST